MKCLYCDEHIQHGEIVFAINDELGDLGLIHMSNLPETSERGLWDRSFSPARFIGRLVLRCLR